MLSTRTNQNWEDVTPFMVQEMIQDNHDVQIVDVREPDEFEQGHIPSIRNIPLSQFVARINEIEPEKETIFVCRSGNRSGQVCEYLSSLGYKRMKNMVGGMNEWEGHIEK